MDFEALWAYQTEDLKADAIANEIRRSPIRIKLEKSRDFIMERQKQYKQIEDSIAAIADRKDVLIHALESTIAQIAGQRSRMESLDPEDEDAVAALQEEVLRSREEIRSLEKELNHMSTDSAAYDKQLRAVRLDAAKAKQTFDQLKVDYENESKVRKEELEQQRTRVKNLEASVDAGLMAEYLSIKKHTTPPVVRLQYGQCSGCNTSLPSATLSKIRNGTLVQCETCGRMIIQ
jgi:predicted  nucleic acid-binding Zn-ribbon protein